MMQLLQPQADNSCPALPPMITTLLHHDETIQQEQVTTTMSGHHSVDVETGCKHMPRVWMQIHAARLDATTAASVWLQVLCKRLVARRLSCYDIGCRLRRRDCTPSGWTHEDGIRADWMQGERTRADWMQASWLPGDWTHGD